MAQNDDQGNKIPDIKDLREGWRRLEKAWLLIRNRKTGEKRMVRIHDGMNALLNRDEEWEVERSFADDKQIETAKILYGEKDKK